VRVVEGLGTRHLAAELCILVAQAALLTLQQLDLYLPPPA
jgi:hypothetical protein